MAAFWNRRVSKALRKIDLSELQQLAGNDWTTVWRKLELQPAVRDGVAVAELIIGDHRAHTVTGFTGYSDRHDVVDALMRQFPSLPETGANEFLDCTRGRGYIVEQLEILLAGAPDVEDD
jgi:hypothetical protein